MSEGPVPAAGESPSPDGPSGPDAGADPGPIDAPESDRAGRRAQRPVRPARRYPGWLLIPLGGGAGWLFGGWGGLVFGVVVGFLLWRTRA